MITVINKWWIFVLLTFITGALLSCSYFSADTEKISRVVLISIDTCRADYLSCYGYPLKTTPNIDAVADDGFLFKNVISPIPSTLPAHCTMLTGTIPPYHGVHDNYEYQLGDSNITLAEILREKGLTTGGIISTTVLQANSGLNQGFDSYDDKLENPHVVPGVTHVEQRGKETTQKAIKWLEKHKDEDFFLFLHYYDPHYSYEPPESFAFKFMDVVPYSKQVASNYAPGNFKSQLALYAGEIAYTDHCIGQVVKKLKELKLYDSTLIIITADHGEMLWEHGEPSHTYFIYQSAIKVPLIFKLPGKNKSKKIETIVGLVDIVPTVCKLLDIEIPKEIHGKDLSGHFSRNITNDPDRVVFCESMTATKFTGNSLLGLVSNRWKYIQTTRPELYDLIEDPYELNDLIREQPHRARLLKDKLQEIVEKSVRQQSSKIKLDTEAIKKLESLGYVSGDIEEDFTFDQSKNDPKDLIDFYQSYKKLDFLIGTGNLKAAKELCIELLDQKPELHLLNTKMASIADNMKDTDSIIYYLSKAVELKPDDLDSFFSLGLIFINKGKLDEAKGKFEKALQINPDFFEAKLWLGKVYYAQKKYTEAIKHFKEALVLKPDSAVMYDNIASAYQELGQIDQAVAYWTKALELKPKNIMFLNTLAWIHAACDIEELRNPTYAASLAKKACELTKYKNPQVLDTLGAAYAAAGNFDKAIETSLKAIDIARTKNKNDLAGRIQKRLDLYRQGEAYLDPSLKK